MFTTGNQYFVYTKDFMEKREGRKRLSMDVPLEVWEKVEKNAEKRNITITKFILQAILEKIRNEQCYE